MGNDAQTRLWKGPAGEAWAEAQELLDLMFQPIEALLTQSLPAGARAVLDVGCGTGATTLAAAHRLGQAARCVGIDVSDVMVKLARRRAGCDGSPTSFLVADAQTYDFDPATFDAVISRFGVMFFDDPVRAFANLHRATRPGGTLSCVTFRDPTENAFMTAAECAAASLLPGLPPRPADAPGQFAFAKAPRVQALLEAAGWRDVLHQRIDIHCAFPEPALAGYVTRLGPVGVALRGAEDELRNAVSRTVRAAFAPFIHGDEVRFVAACWHLNAKA